MEEKGKEILTEEERTVIKKAAHMLARFVLDELENDKRRTNSCNDDPHVRELVRNLAVDLSGAFSWGYTREGHNYWANVYSKLRRIAEEGF